MNDDELIDRMLRETMADEVPRLSPAFDANVMASVRPRRLSRLGRAVMGAYSIAALAIAVWTMWEVGATLMAASAILVAVMALGLSSYARLLTMRSSVRA
jgi:hypothetical protein